MQNYNYGSLFLASEGISVPVLIIAIIAAVIVAGTACLFLGLQLKKKSFERKQGDIQKITTEAEATPEDTVATSADVTEASGEISTGWFMINVGCIRCSST